MPVSQKDAAAIAEQTIGLPDKDRGVLHVRDRGDYWMVIWGVMVPADHVYAGPPLLGNAPVLVRKSDGAVIPTATAEPLDFYVENYERLAGEDVDDETPATPYFEDDEATEAEKDRRVTLYDDYVHHYNNGNSGGSRGRDWSPRRMCYKDWIICISVSRHSRTN